MFLILELSDLARISRQIKQAATDCSLVNQLSDTLANLMKRNQKGESDEKCPLKDLLAILISSGDEKFETVQSAVYSMFQTFK